MTAGPAYAIRSIIIYMNDDDDMSVLMLNTRMIFANLFVVECIFFSFSTSSFLFNAKYYYKVME